MSVDSPVQTLEWDVANSKIGLLKPAFVVEDAVIARLRLWSSTYLAEVERQYGYDEGFAARLHAVEAISALSRFPEDQLPAAFVVGPGTSEEPSKGSDGYYEATYRVGVMVVASAVTEHDTRKLAQLYGAAVRGCVLQGRSLGIGAHTDWAGESLDDLPIEDRRTVQASVQLFDVTLLEVVSWKQGPVQPTEPPVDPLDPLPDWPTADDVSVEVDQKEG